MGSSQSRPYEGSEGSKQFTQGPIPQREPALKKEADLSIGKGNLSATEPYVIATRPIRETNSSHPPSISTPAELLQLPSVKFGGYSAVAGLTFGSFFGIFRGQPPLIYPVLSSIQWGLAGTCFYGVRSTALELQGDTRENRLAATTIASAIAGGAAGAITGRRSVMPTAFTFAVIGLGGQWIWDRRAERSKEAVIERKSWLERLTTNKYSPMKMMTDEEYKDILEAKLLKVEADIAVLEDDMEALKKSLAKTET